MQGAGVQKMKDHRIVYFALVSFFNLDIQHNKEVGGTGTFIST